MNESIVEASDSGMDTSVFFDVKRLCLRYLCVEISILFHRSGNCPSLSMGLLKIFVVWQLKVNCLLICSVFLARF